MLKIDGSLQTEFSKKNLRAGNGNLSNLIKAHNYMIKISIITICFNSERDIEITMKSVIEQKYKKVEYIIIDGLSTDSTIKKAERLKDKYLELDIQIYSEKDKGIYDAMNKGIDKSTGQLICHLHAGDYFIQDNTLSQVVESYNKFNWQWGVGSSIVIDEKCNELFKYRPCKNKEMLKIKNCIPHQSTFIDRKLFKELGVFKVDYDQAMDYDLWLRFAFLGNKNFYILDFDVTCFLDGGVSADIKSLIKILWKIRRNGERYKIYSNVIEDIVYVTRVFLFNIYRQLQGVLKK